MADNIKQNCSKEFLDEYDVILYFGRVTYEGYFMLSDRLDKLKANGLKKAYFVPVTPGGDPDAAFRIGRALGHHYPDHLIGFVPYLCKSAGTLITLGCKEMIVTDRGELGPLDIQIRNKEELAELSSGLDIIESLTALQESLLDSFRRYLTDIKFGSGLGTKLAAGLASEMAGAFVSSISSQIDPIRLGEHQRLLRIAKEYGMKLNQKFKNSSAEKIGKLAYGYPSHDYVIDRREANEIFNLCRNIESPDEEILDSQVRVFAEELFSKEKPMVIDYKEFCEYYSAPDESGPEEDTAEGPDEDASQEQAQAQTANVEENSANDTADSPAKVKKR